MANKDYQALSLQPSGTFTKIRAEQIRSEDSLGSLAIDLEALRGQVKDIIGAGDYKEEITGEYAKVQIVDLAAHLDASGATSLSVKQDANVVGAFSVNTDKFSVVAASGNTAVKGTLDVDGQATLASALVENMAATAGLIVFHGADKVLGDDAALKFESSYLSAPGVKVTDLTPTRVVFVGASDELVDSEHMTYAAGVLTVSGSTFGEDVSVAGDLTVAGDFRVNGALTYVDTQNLLVKDAKIVISSGSIVDGAGIYLGDESAGENIRWETDDGGKWIASDKLMADTLQAGDLSSAIVWADASGNLVEISDADLGAAINGRLAEGTGVDFSLNAGTGVTTISIGQEVYATSSVTFASVIGSNLTVNRLMKSDADSKMISADIVDFVTGTANQVNLTPGAFGNVVLSTPQDIHSLATPTFAALNVGTIGDLLADGSDFKLMAASAALSFDDSYRAASTWAAPLKLATTASQWDQVELAYGGEKSLLQMLIEAAPSTVARKVHTFTVSGGATSTLTKAVSASWPAALMMGGGRSDVYVNGQLQFEGPSKDFQFGAAGADSFVLNFTYNLQNDDVVRVVRYAAAVTV